MMPNKEGMCHCQVERHVMNDTTLFYDQQDRGGEKVGIELFLIGDLKYLFMVLGRSGFSGSWCLYCQLKQSEWVRQHKAKNCIHCNGKKWTIEEILATSLTNQQADGQMNNDFEETFLKGVRDAPLWDFIPIKNVIPPILHILLGLGNDLVNKLLEWLDT